MPFRGRFSHTRAELIADGVVHTVGLVLASTAGSVLLAFAFVNTGPWEYAATLLYVAALLTLLSVSMAYNLWPVSRVKWVLRRFDHASIYLMIAATYSPFLAQLEDEAAARTSLALVWGAAGIGMLLKIVFPGRFDRLAVAFYLAIGWSGVVVAQALFEILPASTVRLVVAGGLVYSVGVVFFVWQSLRFQSAVWHGFVVLGAGLHMAAMLDCMVIARL